MAGSPIDPSFQYAPVTPADNAPLLYHNVPTRAKAFYIGGNGNLTILDDDGSPVTFTGVIAGVVYPFSAGVVMATNTTATNIVALF